MAERSAAWRSEGAVAVKARNNEVTDDAQVNALEM
jgi:hypothetical protein